MVVGSIIMKQLKKRNLTQTWLANEVGIKRVTFALKMKKDRFTAIELIKIGQILDLDLNIFKNEMADLPLHATDF